MKKEKKQKKKKKKKASSSSSSSEDEWVERTSKFLPKLTASGNINKAIN